MFSIKFIIGLHYKYFCGQYDSEYRNDYVQIQANSPVFLELAPGKKNSNHKRSVKREIGIGIMLKYDKSTCMDTFKLVCIIKF